MIYNNNIYHKNHTNLRTLNGLYGINLFELNKFTPYIGESENKNYRLNNPNDTYIENIGFTVLTYFPTLCHSRKICPTLRI